MPQFDTFAGTVGGSAAGQPAPDPVPGSSERAGPVLTVTDVTKTFGAVKALRGASLELVPGEVHVLFGENGAGKSTLINIICGVFQQDEGTLVLDGAEVRFRNVTDARRQGIAAMFQEFSLVPALTIEQNLLLGREPGRFGLINGASARAEAQRALDRLGFRMNLDAMTGDLSRAEQQMVEMAKVLIAQPRILILDEPTASLSERETDALFDIVRRLRSEGVAIIYITHRLREIDAIADRITIMRDGQYITTRKRSDVTNDMLIELMIGRQIGDLYPAIDTVPGRPIAAMRGLSTSDGSLSDISIELREGEIVGIAGLVGCGKSEIGRALFGLQPRSSGEIVVDGAVVDAAGPAEMLGRKVCYITSDRRTEGLMIGRSTKENIALSSLASPAYSRRGMIRAREEVRLVDTLARQLHLRPLDLDADVSVYSGGNQQKVVIARALALGARVLIFDEPTVGVDVGARAEIYRLIVQLARDGCAILMISSDMPEIMNLCHRTYVVSEGRIVDELPASEMTEQRLLQGFFGRPTHAHSPEGVNA